MTPANSTAIAIIGMSGRWPGAPDLDAFWRNLRDGVEAVSFFSDQELAESGVGADLMRDPHYVRARAILDDIDLFDAAFFGYTPREAEIIDPQQRLFLECAVAALGSAGYDPQRYAGLVGVYAGVSSSTYLLYNLIPNVGLVALTGAHQLMIGNEKDHLPTRVSYKLGLTGPSVSVNTTCSTSLVAVHLACQSLLAGECDMALAGGASIFLPQKAGYLYQEGGTSSPDGHCRAFDARAQGLVSGNGMGIVVLRRLEDALADGDTVQAVILGSAINNDGALKASYTAPSVEGQSRVIAEALALAGVGPDAISYVEAHGTGTPLGDPVEIAALTRAFHSHGGAGSCAIGSVKTNIGHLDAAAGVSGLIKTVLALRHRQLPPSLHFASPNPNIDFAHSPFYVNASLREWRADGAPRRAGVSSFGIGGTNAHVIVEEAPAAEPSGPSRPHQLLLLSARSGAALEAMTDDLAAALRRDPAIGLADVAYTLQVGRGVYRHRRALVARDRDDALAALATRDPERVLSRAQEPLSRPIAFLFPGQGAQYLGMGAGLYQAEPVFRAHLDRCAELLLPHLGRDIRAVIFDQRPTTNDQRPTTNGLGATADESPAIGVGRFTTETTEKKADGAGPALSADDHVAAAPSPIPHPPSPIPLDETWLTQPALFAVEYALAQLWLSWGVRPQALIGHSIGEYVAACLAGVFSLEDALALVAARGRLIQALPGGTMLSVNLPEAELRPLLDGALDLAAVNAPALCVVAGPAAAVDALERRLAERGAEARRLRTSHAFHSSMMDPALAPFAEQVRAARPRAPQLPIISNLTGAVLSAAEATDPAYWARHLRATVRFADGIALLSQEPSRIFLEVGPGRTLGTLARQTAERQIVLASLRHPRDPQPDEAFLLAALGKLWLADARIDWAGFAAHERRRRIPLPTYPFERRRYWVEPGAAAPAGRARPEASAPAAEAADLAPLHPREGRLTAYAAPTNEIERRLAAIWQTILGIEAVGIHDDFFELGGHSLMATRLIVQLREAFPVEVPLQTFFELPTVARLAEFIAEKLIEQLDQLSEEEVQMLL